MFDFLKKIAEPFRKTAQSAAQGIGYIFGASEREQEERRKREEEERRRREAERQKAIDLIIPKSVKRAQESVQKTVGDFFAPVPDKVRVRDIARELPGSAEKVGGGILDFGKAILRAIPRAAGSVTLSAQGREEFIPETPAEKFLFGDEPVRDIRGTGEETIEAFGGSKETASRYGLPLGVALTSLDLIPGLPKKKIAQEVGEQLIKRYGDDVAKLIVQKGGKKLAEKALSEGGEKAVEKAGIKLVPIIKAVRQSHPGAVTTDAVRGGTWYTTPESRSYNFTGRGKDFERNVGGAVKTERMLNAENPLIIKNASIEEGSFAVINEGYESYLPKKYANLANEFYEKTRGVADFSDLPDNLSYTEIVKRTGMDVLKRAGFSEKEIASIGENANYWDVVMDKIVSKGLREAGHDALILENAYKGRVIDRHIFKFADEAVQVAERTPKLTERRARVITKASITADEFAPALEAQKRGKIPFPEIIKRSKELDADIGRIANLKPGTVKNAEQVEAYRQAINGFKDDVLKLEQNFVADPSPQNKALLDSARAKLNKATVNIEAIRSELARGLSASRIEDDISRAARNLNRVREQLPADKQLIFDRSLDQLNLASEADVARFLTEWQDASFIAKVVEYYKAALLSAPITHVRNLVGNTSFLLFDIPVRALAGGMDAVRAVGGKPRTVYANEAPRMIYSGLKSIPDAVTEAMRAFRDEFYQYGARRLTIEAGQRLPAIKGTKGKIIRFPYRALSALDLFSRTIKTNMEVDALAYRLARQEGKKGMALVERVEALKRTPPAGMLKLATDKADRALFLEELDGMLGSLGQMIAKYPALQFITPFYRTPVNLLREAYRLTPARFITAKSDPWLLNQSTKMEEVARTTLGSLMGGTIMWKMLDGSIDITGRAPTTGAERDLFYRQGRQPYSVRIGDNWYSYREIQPFSTVAFMFSQLGELVQTYKDKGDMDEKQIAQQVNRITTDMAQFIQDQSFFQGLANFTEAISGGTYNQGVVQAGSNYLENLFGGFIPNIVYSFQRAADPVIYASEGFAEGIKKRIPGLAESLTPRRDIYGRPLERAGTGITRFLSPVQVSKERRDLVDDEMEKLGIAVGYPGRTAFGEALTNFEYDALVQDSGARIYESLHRVMSSPNWSRMSEYERENTVEKVARDARSQSRIALFQQKKKVADIKKAYLAQGYPEVQAQIMAEKDAASGAQRPTGGAPRTPTVGDIFPSGGSAISADDLVRQITQSRP